MKATCIVALVLASGAFALPQPWCGRPNTNCSKVKRAVGAFAQTMKSSQQLIKKDSVANMEAKDIEVAANGALSDLGHLLALSDDNPEQYVNSLGLAPEEPKALVKRDDGSVEAMEAEDRRSCLAEGGACWIAKRAADAVLEIVNANQDESPKAVTAEEEECFRPGNPCWHEKRNILALRSVASEISAWLQ
ncbi:hypothetical protein XA68_11266 [Ophiocordyceps unilateralis]|uniref:Clock-controlled pheromone ccg-4 n=1 Tax=Ophiocordyceps unilateralis TaxID=268505 RepID=A0A2A9PFS4_OPHUN|nr:hypothetical protein XA68_11266 [Ophiocordyceps unilateralis]